MLINVKNYLKVISGQFMNGNTLICYFRNGLVFLVATVPSFLQLSCNTSKDPSFQSSHSAEQIVIDSFDVQEEADVSDWIETIEIIPLEEKPGSFIGEAFKVLNVKDRYIIFDKDVAKKIIVFDKKGKFIKDVVGIGKGPEEALQLNDCWINNEGHLEVYDFLLKRVFTFDDEFNLLKSRKVWEGLIFNSLMPVPSSSKYIGYKGYSGFNGPHSNNYYKVALLDTLEGIKSTAFHYDEVLNDAYITTPSNPFLKINDTLRFYQGFDPFIYDITNEGTPVKRYELMYSHKPFPQDFENKIVKKNLPVFKSEEIDFNKINKIYKGYTGFYGFWLETNNYILFESFDTDYKPFVILYDKNGKEVIASATFLKEKSNYSMILPSPGTTEPEQDTFISVLPGYSLKHYLLPDARLGQSSMKALKPITW